MSTRIAVCGGTYSNPYAFQAFVDDARARGADRLVCLGDLGGYGAEPDAIWPIIIDNDVQVVAGNYDVAIGRGDLDCGCGYRDPRDNEFAQVMYDYTREHTSPEFAAWMRGLSTEHRETADGVDLHLVHGSTLVLNDFWWESLPAEQHLLRVQESGADVICCTHSGLPWTKRVQGTTPDGSEVDTLVVNVGVLGRPANDGERNVWYAMLTLDDGRASAELVPLDYDWRAQAASMRAGGLPEAFVETVETGWWTTCLEVVPPVERSRGRYQLYRSALPTGAASSAASWADAPEPTESDLPVVPLFGSALFPPRLWVYTNFHCNLACSYCSVASSPQARRRSIGRERLEALVDEAVAEGLHRDLPDRRRAVPRARHRGHGDLRQRPARRRAAHQRDALPGLPRRAAPAPGRPGTAGPADEHRRRLRRGPRPQPRPGLLGQGDGRAARTPSTSACRCASA